jgi:hypothetical protein
LTVLISDFGARILTLSTVWFIDGTFSTMWNGLILTVLMALWDNVAVPCGFGISDSRETGTYCEMFEVNKLLLLFFSSTVFFG